MKSTGAEGDRLKEANAINTSLSTLGKVIQALVDRSNGKNVQPPYRDSVLTQLLREALGGNSRTLMVCALSPADINYDETFSTLRYADSAKKIKNVVRKNVNPAQVVEALKAELAKMKQMLEGGGMSLAERQLYEENKLASEKMIADMQKSFEQRYAEMQAEQERQRLEQLRSDGPVSLSVALTTRLPRITNLHEDPMLSESLVYTLKQGITVVGSEAVGNAKQGQGGPGQPHRIQLMGVTIKPKHACLTNNNGLVSIEPIEQNMRLYVNGELVTKQVELTHGDRIIFGNNIYFRYETPESSSEPKQDLMTWEQATSEFQQKQGLRMSMADVSKLAGGDGMVSAGGKETAEQRATRIGMQLLREDMNSFVTLLDEANTFATELNKDIQFVPHVASKVKVWLDADNPVDPDPRTHEVCSPFTYH